MERTRRAVLSAAAGSLAAGPLAGCVADAQGEAYAAFFPLASMTRGVAGERTPVNDPVPVGQVGHGWSPGSDLTLSIATAEVFVYLDTPEFGWAQDVADVVAEEDHGVLLVDALEGIDLRSGGGGDHGHGGHGHDAAHDPHVWVDPVNAATMVETIHDGFVEADPDNEDTYRENADATLADLSALDSAYESTVADAEHDALVLASHDSFEYLAARYGFEIHTPVGISPHEEPSTRAVIETVEFVDDRGIEYVCYDTFQSPAWAETIVAESSATDTLPLSPVSATTRAWNDRGWGYVEQMREYNLPTVARALGAGA